MKTGWLVLLLLAAAGPLAGMTLTIPLRPAGGDYGAGSAVCFTWHPGGFPDGVGLNIGHLDEYTHRNRVLLRFRIGMLQLLPDSQEIVGATLRLHYREIRLRDGKEHDLTVEHLPESRRNFNELDLTRAGARRLAQLPLRSEEPVEIDVTEPVRLDRDAGRIFSAYRLLDAEGEAGLNSLQANYYSLWGLEREELQPVLVIELQEAR